MVTHGPVLGGVAVVLLLLGGCTRPAELRDDRPPAIERLGAQLENFDGGIMVVAHRACWRSASENSIEAIEECIRLGVDMVEIDVRRTADGNLVVIHDDTVDRTTNGHGPVSAMTLAELRRLRLKAGLGGDDANLTDEGIPTLRQAFSVVSGRILVNLDAKGDVLDHSYALARDMGVAAQVLLKMTLVSPGDEKLTQSAFFGHTWFMPIIREANGALDRQVTSYERIRPVAFEVIYQSEQQLSRACEAASAQHSRCWVNTMWESLSPGHSDDVSVLDPDEHWGYLVGLGVNMFQTDRPEELIDYLSARKLRCQDQNSF